MHIAKRNVLQAKARKFFFALLLFLLCLNAVSFAQKDFFQPSSNYNPSRVNGLVITQAIGGAVITFGLNYLWYRKFPHSKFHLFNDNGEWLNMDKAGHATTAYNIAAFESDFFRWAGVKRVPSAAIGSLTALSFMTMIELLDGHSAKWGFSIGDMLANLSGVLLFQGQEWMWNEQRISLKFSYHYTMFAKYYPQELGKTWKERLLKDYNGQTYWLSFNIGSFLSSKSDFPKWLDASIGYGAEGMIGARENPKEVNGLQIPEFKRYRQFYFSFDTDLYRIENTSDFARTLLKFNKLLKMPAPTIEWNKMDGMKLYPIYY